MLGVTAHPRSIVVNNLPKHSVGAEIGVHLGEFSAAILNVAQPRKLHLIDPWVAFEEEGYESAMYSADRTEGGQAGMDARYEGVAAMLKPQVDSGQVEIHRAFSADIADRFDDGYFDWVYIDGDHTFEGVTKDLEAYFSKVRPGGFLICDDYMLGKWWGDGVVRAVHEFLAARPVILSYSLGTQVVMQRLD